MKLKNSYILKPLFVIFISTIFLTSCGLNLTGDRDDEKSNDTESVQTNRDNATIQVSKSVTIVPSSVGDLTGEMQLLPFGDVAGDDPAVGELAPQFTTQRFDESSVTVRPEGKPYVLIFLAHWCPNCQAEVPKLVKMHKDEKLPDNVEYYGVATATTNQQPNYPPSRWLHRANWPWTTVLDNQSSDIANAFGVSGYPFLVFVNADGTISQRVSGQVPESQFISLSNAIAATAQESED